MKNVSEIAKAIRANGIKIGQERLVYDLEEFPPVVQHNRIAIYRDRVINDLCYKYTGDLKYYMPAKQAPIPPLPGNMATTNELADIIVKVMALQNQLVSLLKLNNTQGLSPQ